MDSRLRVRTQPVPTLVRLADGPHRHRPLTPFRCRCGRRCLLLRGRRLRRKFLALFVPSLQLEPAHSSLFSTPISESAVECEKREAEAAQARVQVANSLFQSVGGSLHSVAATPKPRVLCPPPRARRSVTPERLETV